MIDMIGGVQFPSETLIIFNIYVCTPQVERMKPKNMMASKFGISGFPLVAIWTGEPVNQLWEGRIQYHPQKVIESLRPLEIKLE